MCLTHLPFKRFKALTPKPVVMILLLKCQLVNPPSLEKYIWKLFLVTSSEVIFLIKNLGCVAILSQLSLRPTLPAPFNTFAQG